MMTCRLSRIVKAAMAQNLQTRYNGVAVKRLLALASVVHPMFKHLGWMDEEKEAVYSSLEEIGVAVAREIEDNNPPEPNVAATDEPEVGAAGFFDDDIMMPDQPAVVIKDVYDMVNEEITRYKLEGKASGVTATKW